MGRPPVPSHLKRDKRLVVMMTSAESDQLSKAAEIIGAASLSDWVRETLIGDAQKIIRRSEKAGD